MRYKAISVATVTFKIQTCYKKLQRHKKKENYSRLVHNTHMLVCIIAPTNCDLNCATHNSTVGEEGMNKPWADGVSRRGGNR